MLDFLKDFKRDHVIKKLKDVGREKKIKNLSQIKTIGIVFEVGSEYDWNILYYFIQAMEKQGKRVNIIGFQPAEVELNFIITHAHTIVCREKEDFNFWGEPKDDVVSAFLDKHYDVVIDTTTQPNFFGQYLSMKADSDLRITMLDKTSEAATEVMNCYDMMIESDGPMDMKDYLNNVVNYLSMIQK